MADLSSQDGGDEALALLEYWFGTDTDDPEQFARHKKKWFAGGEAVDREIADRFAGLHARAARGDLDAWALSGRGRLALILLFDQLTRNLYRGTGAAFALDDKAFALAEAGIALELDAELSVAERVFFYMPYQHAESLPAQERGVELFATLALADAPPHVRATVEGFAAFAREHHDIVVRFGRFPHRNRLLDRSSTAREEAYLGAGAPTFGQ